MFTALHQTKICHKPLGIWAVLILILFQIAGHAYLAGANAILRPPSIVAFVLSALALIALYQKRFEGMVLGIAYFILGIYSAAFLVSKPYCLFCISIAFVWWLSSAAGIAALRMNLRWFNEKLPEIPYPVD